MVEDTIQKIKATEKEADQLIDNADSECKKILDEAEQKAADLVADARRMGKEKAQSDLEEAKAGGAAALSRTMDETEKEIMALRGLVGQKKDAAVTAVIDLIRED